MAALIKGYLVRWKGETEFLVAATTSAEKILPCKFRGAIKWDWSKNEGADNKSIECKKGEHGKSTKISDMLSGGDNVTSFEADFILAGVK